MKNNKIKKYLKLLSYIGPYKKQRIFIVLICTLSIITSSFLPYLIGNFISKVQMSVELKQIISYGLIIFCVGAFSSVLESYQNYKWHSFRIEVINYFRTLMMKVSFNKEMSYFRNKNEDFGSRILEDSVIVAQSISIGVAMLYLNVLRIIVVFALMLRINIKLSIIILCFVPIYTMYYHYVDKRVAENSRKERSSYSQLSNNIKNILKGILHIKIYNKEEYFYNGFNDKVREYSKFSKNLKLYDSIGYGVGQFIKTILPVTILIVGAIEVYNGRMSLGYLFTFYAYLEYLYEPMMNLSDWYSGTQVTLGMSDRVVNYLECNDEISGDTTIDEIFDIRFEDVSFGFETETKILNNFNLHIQKGDVLGIVGKSGSGKSTLINLILKIWKNYEGNILINGVNLKSIDTNSLYKCVSYVEQENFIFNGTLRENIAFENDKDNEINNCIRFARIDDQSIKRDDFVILDDGYNLSSGQKQRISIARCFYKNSSLIILDEFTSNIDKEIENEILNNLMSMNLENKIVIIVSHRENPLKLCNKILNLNEKKSI